MVHEKKRGRSVTTLFFCYVVWEVIECPITPLYSPHMCYLCVPPSTMYDVSPSLLLLLVKKCVRGTIHGMNLIGSHDTLNSPTSLRESTPLDLFEVPSPPQTYPGIFFVMKTS